MPALSSVPKSGPSIMGVSIQGASNIDTAAKFMAVDPYMPPTETRYIDIYTRTDGSFSYTVTSNISFVTVSSISGTIKSPVLDSDSRVKISVDWSAAPAGTSYALLTVANGSSNKKLTLPINNFAVPSSFKGFVESNGAVSIEAEHYGSKTDAAGVGYVTIPNYGRTLSGVTLMPVTIPSQTTASGPKLNYNFHAFNAKTGAKVMFYLSASLNVDPKHPLKYAFEIDDGVVKTVQPVPTYTLGTDPTGWTDAVNGNSWISSSTVDINAGSHVLKVWALEPGVVFEKIVIDLGGVRSSYLGPPESRSVGGTK